MNIIMSSVDYNVADIKMRESISLTKSRIKNVYDKIKENSNILGMVIISTCNRTEVYMSLIDEIYLEPLEFLCYNTGIDYSLYKDAHIIARGDDAVKYLSRLACGVRSQIWGDDQIITQVREALEFARENNASDSILEVLFRQAVSAAKKVRTELGLRCIDDNAGKRAVMLIKKKLNNPKVLVIGNGMAGRAAAEQLIANGIAATITLRKYKHSDNIVPKGAETVDYHDRYSVLKDYDAVISATSSPHFTIEYDRIAEFDRKPKIFIDMAVPRDIDERIGSIKGTEYFDIDDISGDELDKLHKKQYGEIDSIIQKYTDDFHKWYEYKKGMEDRNDI